MIVLLLKNVKYFKKTNMERGDFGGWSSARFFCGAAGFACRYFAAGAAFFIAAVPVGA